MQLALRLLAVLCLTLAAGAARADELHVLAAGSLREAIGEIGAAYGKATGITVKADFGPSGVLRERIEKGEPVDLFASADMGHPLRLLDEGKATRVAMFTRNALCGIALPKTGLTTADFLERLLDPAVKLGTSTPKADPGGDYTWAMFHRADGLHPGAFGILDRKAQKIVGGPGAVSGDPVVDGLKSGRIDVMIGYCSGKKRLAASLPDAQFVEPPREIAGGPEYGLAIFKDSSPRAPDLALFILSPDGQRILAQNGFAPVGLPAPAP